MVGVVEVEVGVDLEVDIVLGLLEAETNGETGVAVGAYWSGSRVEEMEEEYVERR